MHLCADRVTGVLFAAKIFNRPKSFASPRSQTLYNEIQALRELQKYHNPNITRMVDAFVDFESDKICIVMDFAREGELFNHIVTKEKFTEAETRRIFNQLLSAIQFLVSYLLFTLIREAYAK